ncbi:MAG: M20 family metallopeptidase [Bacillota bacterium]|nr:M20 family metallopeptidase [Bacillota bacterium]
MNREQSLISLLEGTLERIVEDRNNLHEIPELGHEEFLTCAYIRKQLDELGIQYEVHGTGTIAYIPSETPTEGAIAFRSDIDGLPILEETDNPRPSKHVGRMHACGHDGHMSMLLGLARLLASGALRIKKNIVLIFQPAEEGPGGAQILIDTGFMQRYDVREVHGCHLHPSVEQGKYAVCAGPFMAQTADVDITIRSTSAHGAMPHLGTDGILVAAQLIQALQTIVSRNLDPVDSGVVTVGTIHGGERRNVIAKEVKLELTIRALRQEVFEQIKTRLSELCTGIAAAHGVEMTFEAGKSYPPVYNDPGLTEEFFRLNPEAHHIAPQMIAEDFSAYQRVVPGVFFYVGVRNEAKGRVYPLHSASFGFEPEALLGGPKAYLRLLAARDAIAMKGDQD